MKYLYVVPVIMLFTLLGVITVTSRNYSKPNVQFFSDMVVSPASQSQASSNVFANEQVMQLPPTGTIHRGVEVTNYDNTNAGLKAVADTLKNPIELNDATLKRGQEVFTNFCTPCHGFSGMGDGGVAAKYPAFGYPIATANGYKRTDGDIFHLISYGGDKMPSHRSQIRPNDRWKAIHYLRDLQRKTLKIELTGEESK